MLKGDQFLRLKVLVRLPFWNKMVKSVEVDVIR